MCSLFHHQDSISRVLCKKATIGSTDVPKHLKGGNWHNLVQCRQIECLDQEPDVSQWDRNGTHQRQ
jgi:hypothetical protein